MPYPHFLALHWTSDLVILLDQTENSFPGCRMHPGGRGIFVPPQGSDSRFFRIRRRKPIKADAQSPDLGELVYGYRIWPCLRICIELSEQFFVKKERFAEISRLK
jgi:hypothetical protein